MGLFTYRQAKKTRHDVQALGRQQADQSAVDRELALFQQLPPDGKEEYRQLDAEYRASFRSFRLQNPFTGDRIAEKRRELFRKYDLIP